VTRDELARAAAVASRVAAAEAKLVKGEGVVPAGIEDDHACLECWPELKVVG
jgi:hypothetical protein